GGALLEDGGPRGLEKPPRARAAARPGTGRAPGAREPRPVLRSPLMPWPEAIASLLARPDSRPAQALRWGLHGLRASLRAALEEGAADPGAEDLRALLAELAPLVDRGATLPGATLPLDSATAPPGQAPPGQAPPGGPPAGRDPRVSPGDEGLAPLADAVSAGLWLAEDEPHLCHFLNSVVRFRLPPPRAHHRDPPTAERRGLADGATAAGRAGPKERLKAQLDLDEALHSLIHQPPEAAPPWWGRLREQARAALFAARDEAARAGVAGPPQEAGGQFPGVNRRGRGTLHADCS